MRKRSIATVLICALVMCVFIPALARVTSLTVSQTAQEGDTAEIFFTVNDEEYAPITGLTADEVTLAAGSTQLTAELSAVKDAGKGVAYVFVVDISKSLKEKHFVTIRKSLTSWVDMMGSRDKASIITIGEQVTSLVEYTNDSAALKEAIGSLAPTDMKTKLHDGLRTALNIAVSDMDGLPPQRVLVLISDCMDDYPTGITYNEVYKEFEKNAASVTLFCAGFTNTGVTTDEIAKMAEMARMTGGEMYPATEDPATFDTALTSAAYRMQNSYVATAKLPGELSEGGEKQIYLTVTHEGVTVKANVDMTVMPFTPEAPEDTSEPEPTAAPAETSEPSGTEAPDATAAPDDGEEPAADDEDEDEDEAEDEGFFASLTRDIDDWSYDTLGIGAWVVYVAGGLLLVGIVVMIVLLATAGKRRRAREAEYEYDAQQPLDNWDAANYGTDTMPAMGGSPENTMPAMGSQNYVPPMPNMPNMAGMQQPFEAPAYDPFGPLPGSVQQPAAADGARTVQMGREPAAGTPSLLLTEHNTEARKKFSQPLDRPVRVGRRGGENEIVVADKTVSGHHCVFTLRDDGVYVTDANSVNKTFIIDNRGRQEADGITGIRVKPGDILRIGNSEFEIGLIS